MYLLGDHHSDHLNKIEEVKAKTAESSTGYQGLRSVSNLLCIDQLSEWPHT